ncbi:thioredoxin family protein [Sulfurovum sp. zt1-1]|uniref:Thioredoxin family protein n=1 Tax=Sulfurovum zhangzhouensis TaxID=3019067 RepID=A0ABT7R0N7_9BACT|nr:thioredoxin family protein [Sulfurovum zhangzhouensis]MDM5272660.1 thioredoxin family protein [Sulfurovum zhangzhouensis]
MRKIISVWAITLLFTSSLFGVELIWEKDTATAFAKAKAEKKNVMLMVEATHCRWCKKMKEETLADKEVRKRLQNYILVMILRSDEKAMKILPESYYPAPTTFFMTPEGEIIEKAIGYFEADDFITYINDVEAD